MRWVWLAAADARGHVMRAHVMKRVMRRRGVDVEIVTTSEEGRAFLAALGTEASVLSPHYGIAFDERQNMARRTTERSLFRYLVTPSRAAADKVRLDELCEGADLLVNDFHPLPLLFAKSPGCPVVHVHGENLWKAIEDNFQGRGTGVVDMGYGAFVRRMRARAAARLEHSLTSPRAGAYDAEARSYRLLPVLEAPARSRAAVRAELGLSSWARVAAVYCNPHFRDASLAEAIEKALAASGFAMVAVGEGYAHRPGWKAYDPRFADVLAASDLVVSAPGMGVAGYAKLLGLPFVAIVTDQPEQTNNLRSFDYGEVAPVFAARGSREHLEEAFLCAIDRMQTRARTDAGAWVGVRAIERVQEQWADALTAVAKRRPTITTKGAAYRHAPENPNPLQR